MEWLYFLVPFVLLGSSSWSIAFRGGAGAAREAATGGGSGARAASASS